MKPFFSICIPNYNYGAYIGETIDSVLQQTFQNFEICICDNASTDNSWEVITRYCNQDTRIRAVKNRSNIGFAGNLDAVSAIATGDWHIMLSSDDLMAENALELYFQQLKKHAFDPMIVINSGFQQFDNMKPEKNFYVGFNKFIWQRHEQIGTINDKNIILDSSANLLRHGIQKFVSPFNFVALCYSRRVYEDVNGYGGTRMMNPDRWFHWKVCTRIDKAIFIDLPLFQYRWHDNNQTAKQNRSGVLKFWVDEYRNCFELDETHFQKSGLTREETEKFFFKKVIVGYGYASLAYGFPLKSLRITAFGIFTYPLIFFSCSKSIILCLAMICYPITWALSHIVKHYFNRKR